MPPHPFNDLLLPTPLGTLLASLIAFGGIMALVVLVGLMRKLAPTSQGPGLGTRLLLGIRAADRAMVRGGSLLTGTSLRQSWQRVPRLLLTFAVFTGGGVALPFPAAMLSLTFGLLAILLVFRHWSRDETERAATPAGSAEPLRRTVPIEGDLTIEMALACGYLLVVVPLAFARLHAADLGFQLNDGAGPFAFVFYMVIELLKLGTVVDYYDLFADQIAFGQLAQAHHPSEVAKYVTLSFRVVFDLIILTALKRMFEIAGRISAGQDLREIRAPLESANEDDDPPAIARLGQLSREGNEHARLLLAQVARGELPLGDDKLKVFSSELRMAAAMALRDAGQFGPAVTALEALESDSAESDPDLHARALEQLQLARREYRRQLQQQRTQDLSGQVERLRAHLRQAEGTAVRQDLARALRSLATVTRKPALLREAAETLRIGLNAVPRASRPLEWSGLQGELAKVLRRLGERDADTLEAAIQAFRAALEVADAASRPVLNYELAQTLRKLQGLRPAPETLAAAQAALAAALAARPGNATWLGLQSQLERAAADT